MTKTFSRFLNPLWLLPNFHQKLPLNHQFNKFIYILFEPYSLTTQVINVNVQTRGFRLLKAFWWKHKPVVQGRNGDGTVSWRCCIDSGNWEICSYSRFITFFHFDNCNYYLFIFAPYTVSFPSKTYYLTGRTWLSSISAVRVNFKVTWIKKCSIIFTNIDVAKVWLEKSCVSYVHLKRWPSLVILYLSNKQFRIDIEVNSIEMF